MQNRHNDANNRPLGDTATRAERNLTMIIDISNRTVLYIVELWYDAEDDIYEASTENYEDIKYLIQDGMEENADLDPERIEIRIIERLYGNEN